MNRWTVSGALGAIAFVALIVAVGPVLTFVIVIGATGLLVVLRFPIAGLYGLVVLLPFNALVTQIAPDLIGTAYGLIKDAVVGLLLIVVLVNHRISRVPPVVVALVLLLVSLPIVSGLFSPTFEQAIYGWRNDYEPLLLLLIVPALVGIGQIRRMLLMIIAMAQVSAVIAISTWTLGVQWLLEIGRLPVPSGERFPTSLFSSGSLTPRAFSPYVAPNEMAAAMLIAIAVIWCAPRLRTGHRFLLTVLPLVAVLLSESRSGLLGAVILGALLAARFLRKASAILSTGFLTLAAFGIVSAAAFYIGDALRQETDTSFGGHADSLQDGFTQMLLHPVGMGLGMVGPRAQQFESSYHVESFWLLIALESGPVVLLLFLGLLALLLSRGMSSANHLGFLAAAAIGATLVSQLVLPTLQEGPVSFLLWLVVGLSIVAQAHERLGSEHPSLEETPASSDPSDTRPTVVRRHRIGR